jgi:hypothetical protein
MKRLPLPLPMNKTTLENLQYSVHRSKDSIALQREHYQYVND